MKTKYTKATKRIPIKQSGTGLLLRQRADLNDKAPLVSVIMPVYNAEKFLSAAIQSVLNQTFSDFELLIIDDASTDRSLTIMQQFAKRDKRIRVFKNRKNVGLGNSLNFLLKKTRGRFIARMDADDISLPNRFAEQVLLLEKNPQLVACGGQEIIIDESGKTLGAKEFPTDPKKSYEMLLLMMPIQPPTLMARGDVMRSCRYDTKGKSSHDDIAVHFQLLQYGGFSNVENAVLEYRVHSNSTTHKNIRNAYFMAFGVRLRAFKNWAYRPKLKTVLLFIVETAIVSLLPGVVIKYVFELMRHKDVTPQKYVRATAYRLSPRI